MKKILLLIAIVGFMLTASAQNNVGIGTTAPDSSAKLDVVSTSQGFLPPRMTTVQRDAITDPATGLIIYNTTEDCMQTNIGTPATPDWQCLSVGETSSTNSILTQIGNEGDNPDTVNSVVTIGQLYAISGPAINGIDAANETAYQDYIDANPDSFSSPATQAEVQAMVDAVNAVISTSDDVLAQIGNEGDNPDTVNSVVTIAQLETITGPEITGLDPANETAYQDYIDANPDSFSMPATQAEVQAMVDAVNAAVAASDDVLAQIGNEGDDPDLVDSVVTVAQLETITGPAITDLDPANQTAYQDYIDEHPDSFSSPATQEEIQAMVDAVNNVGTDTTTAVVPVTSATGRVWMDRNLGANQIPTSATDYEGYGDLYQWGRLADGHEKIVWTSSTGSDGAEQANETATTATSAVPGHGNFIYNDSAIDDNWTDFVGEDDLWQGVDGVNNPCPSGYRIPTEQEWRDEFATWTSLRTQGGYDSALKLVANGYRYPPTGELARAGDYGNYNSSTTDGGTGMKYLAIRSTVDVDVYDITYRTYGFSTRCIQDLSVSTDTSDCGCPADADGDGVVDSADPEPTNPCVPQQAAGYTGYVMGNAAWYDSDCDGDGVNNGDEAINGSDPYDENDTIGAVISATGRIWMDRNLGATQVAYSFDDEASYGDYYQWGRAADGHEKRDSATTTTVATSSDAGHGNFIISNSGNDWNWTNYATEDELWQGLNGVNNPCPSGFRIPTISEWSDEMAYFSDRVGAASSALKLSAAGYRGENDGVVGDTGNIGTYSSATVDGSDVFLATWTSSATSTISRVRGYGRVVRCIQD